MTISICNTEYTEEDVPKDLAEDAIAFQNSCNVGVPIWQLGIVIEKLCKHPRNTETAWINHHPIVVLLAS